jgi:2-dehydro-3-deoxyphosphogluconate aldolase/(4S)-4-hydroxy-2-oxoglutarate aldolase
MPTGGVDLDKENISGWFNAGVKAVGMGSKLISKSLLEEKNYSKIAELTKEVVGIINSINHK